MKTKEISKIKTLKEKFKFVTNHFSNKKKNLVLQFFKQFYITDKKLLSKKQFAQCTLQNKILIKLLIKSGKFKKEDIRKNWWPFWGVHQYLIIKTGQNSFIADPFFKKLEKKFPKTPTSTPNKPQ